MKIWMTILLLASALQGASAAELSRVEMLDCKGTNVSAVVEVSSGTLRGQVRGRTFHNNTIQIVEVVPDLPTEASTSIGGATVGRLGIGQIYVAFSKAQSENLSSSEEAVVLHLDSDGNLHHYPAQCRVVVL